MKASILLALAICIFLTLEFELGNGYVLGPCDEDWADICEDASKWFFYLWKIIWWMIKL